MVTNLVNSREFEKTDALKVLNHKDAQAVECSKTFISGI